MDRLHPGDYIVSAFMFLAIAAAPTAIVLGRRPRPIPYGIGLFCVLLSYASLGLVIRVGGDLAPVIQRGLGLTPLGWVIFLLMPVGWVLIISSVANWKRALALYFSPGLALALLIVSGSGGSATAAWTGFLTLLAWPIVLATLLGAFGLSYG